MSFKVGNRVRGVRGTSSVEGTVVGVDPARRLPTLGGEAFIESQVHVEWDHIPGATTAAERTSNASEGTLERVTPET